MLRNEISCVLLTTHHEKKFKINNSLISRNFIMYLPKSAHTQRRYRIVLVLVLLF